MRYLPAIALMALIGVMSHRELPVDLPAPADKWLHFLAFAVLAGLWVFALGARWSGLAAGFLFSSLWGILDEWHQSFVPGRSASMADVAADVTGALVLVAIVGWVRRIRTRRAQGT